MGGFFLYLSSQGWTWGAALDWSDPFYNEATTVTLAAIVAAQIANVFACRSDRLSIFKLGWGSNPLILVGVAIEVAILLVIIYSPFGHFVFNTATLPAWIFGPLAAGALGLLLAEELRKLIAERIRSPRSPKLWGTTCSSPTHGHSSA